MKNRFLKFAILISPLVLLAGCGSTDVMKNVDGTYTVAAQYGSLNGSWDRASKEANEKALIFCDSKGEPLRLIDERREGAWGLTPQRAEVKFECSKGASTSPETKKVTPGQRSSIEDQLRELKILFSKGLLTKDQYDARVAKLLSRE